MSVVLPGAQSLVSAILADGWAQVRAALAQRWSKKGAITQQAAEQRLDTGHEYALAVAGDGEDRHARLEAYWAGYLAGLAVGQGDLLEAVRELTSSLASQSRGETVHNTNTGTVGTLLQVGEAHGDITIGGH
jgi:hypothetical protein